MTQISFTISNGGTGNTVYMPTEDPSVNQIVLLISSDTPLTLMAGTPVEEKKAGSATGALFYLNLKNLGLTAAELNGLDVTMEGWTTKVFADTQVVCLTPASDMPVAGGQILTATIGNFLASKAPSGATAQLWMNFYRAVPVSTGFLPFTYNNIVTLQAPPSGQLDLHDVIAVSLSNNSVVQSTSDYPQIANAFSLTFGPGPKPKEVKAGPKTVFTINFVYASDLYGYGALATVAEALKIKVATASDWGITDPPSGSGNPGWMLQPKDGDPILGTTSSVDFALSNIITTFQAGPTLMMISYSGVPGYQDGAFTRIIYKEAHVYIHSFKADINPVVLNKGEAKVDLSWTATGELLTLMPGKINVTGLSYYEATIRQSTLFTLIAQGRSQANYATSDLQIDIFPVINSIAATPQNIYRKDFPHDVLLDWSVNTSSEIALSTSISTKVQYFPANTTTGVNVKQPQMFTISPYSSGLPLLIERSMVVSAFDLAKQAVGMNASPQAVALSPTANICAVAQKGSDPIILLETITNAPYGNTISAGSKPVAMAFARDGKRFFVANAGDSSLSVFDITFSSANNNYVFTKVTDVALSGVPVAVAVSADGSAIFVTTNTDNRNPGVLDVVTSIDGTNYMVSNSVSFDDTIGNLAVLPSAAQVFVISPAAQTVYVVGYDSIHQTYQWVRSLAGFYPNDKPVDIAIAGQDSGALLIACSGSGSVYAVSKEAQTVAGKQKLKVGSNPTRVMVVEGGAYAYVANTGDKTLSLIACFKGAGLCSVLESGLDNGSAPTALTSSADGSVIYVGDADSNLTAWHVKTFTDDGALKSVELPTSVASSLQYAVSWHNFNATISNQGKKGTPGLSVYNRSTQTTSLVNASTSYLTFEFWPDEAQNIAIATQKDSNNLYILDTTRFTTVTSVPFSASATAKAIATTISPFGNMIFVLASDKNVYSLVAIACDIKQSLYRVVSTVTLFTQSAASAYSLAAVSDGSSAFVTASAAKKLYVVTGGPSGYRLSNTSYDFIYLPRAMNCAPDDTQLYIWMNQTGSSAFARFDIAAGVLENFALPNVTSFQFNGMTISPDGTRLYVTDSNFGGVRVFSTKAMQNVENVKFAKASFPLGVAIAPDGSGLYTANAFSDNMSIGNQLAADPMTSDIASNRASLSAGAAYAGIFLRDYIGQTPTSNSGSGWTFSPDIIPYGTQVLPNPAVLGEKANYNTEYAKDNIYDQLNNVYVRGLNTNAGVQKSRVYFYSVLASVCLVPGQWSPYGFSFGGELTNWLDITAAKQNDIAYSPSPMNWKPQAISPSTHYCLVAWVDNSAAPTPPKLYEWPVFRTWDDLGNFIKTHPNVAWRNINGISAPGQFMNAQAYVQGPSEGGDVTVGVRLEGIAEDGKGKIRFTLANSNGTISYNSPTQPINANTFSQTIPWPAEAPDPMLTYYYEPEGGKLKGGEKITPFAAFWPGSAFLKFLLLHAPEHLIELPPQEGSLAAPILMMLGTVKFVYTGK